MYNLAMLKNNKIFKNTFMLMILNIAKLVFPFITLPYLTRVLSTDCYGIVAYVKAVMVYMQVIVDFGFTLSATKMVVEAKDDNEKLNKIVSVNVFSKIFLACVSFSGLLVMIAFIPLLRENAMFTILSFVVVFLTVFLFDFLFRGIEQMHIITIRFVVMKMFSTILTFCLVKSDSDLFLIPILDILGSVVAVIWVLREIKKLNIKIQIPKWMECWNVIKESSVYFASNVASTSFNVFNTVVAGIALTTTEIAYWCVCMQIINAIQALYTPISDAIYPEMIRSKSLSLIRKVIRIFMPIITVGCIFTFIFGKWALLILGGGKYVAALPALRGLIPVLFFGFLAIIFGWPSLGAIGRVKETTISTVFACVFQVIIVITLLIYGKLTLFNMAITRSCVELLMFIVRFFYFWKYKGVFNVNTVSLDREQ